MTSDTPLVSILIRSMDRPTLPHALDTVAAQTWPNLEIVVVAACGARHRPLPDTWKGRPLRLVFPEPDRMLPRPDAANLALDSARGEWLNFLDDDDEFLPNHVEALVRATGPAAQRVRYSRAEVRDEHGNLMGHTGSHGFHAQLYFQARSACAATMYHRSLIEEGARFDPAFEKMEDRDFMVNCATRTAFGFVAETTCIWNAQIGESGMGHGQNDDASVREQYLPMLHGKWASAFEAWLAQPQALIFLGKHYLQEGQPEQAVDYLEDALKRLPDDINALNLCGMAHFRADNLQRAEELIARAVALFPQRRELQENLGLIRTQRALANRKTT